jgi:pseudaminic acid biosynthesis-associated methylase
MGQGGKTTQLEAWQGDFGRDYTDRNCLTPEQVDDLWRKNYGVSRTDLYLRFLQGVPKNARILEVGCNIANQLRLLQQLGYSDLHGIEVQSYALEIARTRTRGINLIQSTALDIPYTDHYFDLVFTAGVLIHIAPADLPVAMAEIRRCTRSLIMGAEYYAPKLTEVAYRDHSGLLWKMDYAQEYLSKFPDLQLVQEQRLPYLENQNVDSVFLLRKVL